MGEREEMGEMGMRGRGAEVPREAPIKAPLKSPVYVVREDKNEEKEKEEEEKEDQGLNLLPTTPARSLLEMNLH
jgi:hypothetical protein